MSGSIHLMQWTIPKHYVEVNDFPMCLLAVKFRSISIPTTTSRTERHRTAKYTLYAITYQGVYHNEHDSGTHAKDCKVFRWVRLSSLMDILMVCSLCCSVMLMTVKPSITYLLWIWGEGFLAPLPVLTLGYGGR